MPTHLTASVTSVRTHQINKIHRAAPISFAPTPVSSQIRTTVLSSRFAPKLVVRRKSILAHRVRCTNPAKRGVAYVYCPVAANGSTAATVNSESAFSLQTRHTLPFAWNLINCRIRWFLSVQMRSVKSTTLDCMSADIIAKYLETLWIGVTAMGISIASALAEDG